jgi:dTDP-4-amino-4,6-dideoxygalactose transaminase
MTITLYNLQDCFAYLGYKRDDLPEAEKAAKEIMDIPVYPEFTDEMKDYFVETILSFLRYLADDCFLETSDR